MAFRRIACLLAALALGLPSTAAAQGAGDEQYQDPFGDDGGGQSENQGGGEEPAEEPSGGDAPTSSDDPAPAEEPAPAPAPAQPAGAEADDSGQLPYTGADSGLLALAGGTLVVSGLALRRRTRADRA